MPTTEVSEALQAQLDSIIPGKTYPRYVEIAEAIEGKKWVVQFNLQSYTVGMYAAIYFREEGVSGHVMPQQTGDHNNKGFVLKLKKDIKKALERGATVTIESVVPVKTLTSVDAAA